MHPPTELTTQLETQTISFSVISNQDETSAVAEQSWSQGQRCLFYQLQDGHSYLSVCLPNSIAVGNNGRNKWQEHPFFRSDQEAAAYALAEVLRPLLPIESALVYQTKRSDWGVVVKLSLYWQRLQEIHPRYNPQPLPYSRVLLPTDVLQLPLWYDETRRTGHQTLVFKAGKHYQVVHVPKDLDLGEQGKRDWDTRFFFEASVKAEHFAQCLRLVEGIEDAVVHTHRTRGVPRRYLWLVTVKPAKVS